MISFPRRLHDLAAAAPDRPAVTCAGASLTRAELEAHGNRLARDLAARGVGNGDFVTVALPNSVDWVITYVACWKLGAIPQPVSAKLPARELADIVALAKSRVVVGGPPGVLDGIETLPLGYRPPPDIDDGPLPDAVSPAWKAPTSGGSTGRPKLIVSGDPALIDPEAAPPLAMSLDGCVVVPGPLYHNGPAVWACSGLLAGNHVVLLERFDAEGTLAAIEQHRADVVYLVPTMMKRILRLPDDVRLGYDLSSLRIVWHLAEPCPMWLKEAWIDWLGPDRILELYAGTEAQAVTIITGREWLEHRGSVGRPSAGEFKITDLDGNEVPAGVEGEVWLRSGRDDETYRYVGAEAAHDARGLGVTRRHGLVRCGRLPLPRRPHPGHDPERRCQHLPRRGRVGDPGAPGRAVRVRHRAARRGPRQHRARHRRGRPATRWTSTSCSPSSPSGWPATRCRARWSSSTYRYATTPARYGAPRCGPSGSHEADVDMPSSIIWGRDHRRGVRRPSAAMFDPAVLDPIVDLLADLGDGRALELAIGTGDVALRCRRARGAGVWDRLSLADISCAPSPVPMTSRS